MESKGVAQRNGSVYASIRFIFDNNLEISKISPSAPLGKVHLIISLEPIELLRNIHYIEKNGVIISNNQLIVPKNYKFSHDQLIKEIEMNLKEIHIIYPNVKIISKNYTEISLNQQENIISTNLIMLREIQRIFSNIFNLSIFSDLLENFQNL